MRKLFIDYTNCVPVKRAKVNGGSNYAQAVILNIEKYLAENEDIKNSVKVNILWPEYYEPGTENEKNIYGSSQFGIIKVSRSIADFAYEDGDVLFLPLLGVSRFPVLEKLKRKKITLIVTVHGVRLLDLKWDKYDICYKRHMLPKQLVFFNNALLLPVKKLEYMRRLRKYLQCCDRLVTVSNYTLSRICSIADMENVYLHLQYQDILHKKQNASGQNNSSVKTNKYMLFVSGNREEKNLARTLAAYVRSRRYSPEIADIIITGVHEKTKNALVHNLKLREFTDNQKIRFLDYVDDDFLWKLYSGAEFLLYTSKSEGFGLPVLEAAFCGCPCVAAAGTSIPEVLETAAFYVNPYSEESISRGILWMSSDENRQAVKNRILKSMPLIKQKIKESNDTLLDILLG